MDFLGGYQSELSAAERERFEKACQDARQALQEQSRNPQTVVIAEADPLRFVGGLQAALELQPEAIAFAHADGGLENWKHFPFRPDAALGLSPDALETLKKCPDYETPAFKRSEQRPWFLIPTGGSSGVIKLAVHDENTLTAAAQGFLDGTVLKKTYRALCVLPLYHVSGFMQLIRSSLCRQGRLIFLDFKGLRDGILPQKDPSGWTLSLVPRQLQLLLERPACSPWLAGLEAILVGGGPLPRALADAAQELPLLESYGLTEAAGTVAIRRPHQAGFSPLPHMHLELNSQKCIHLQSSALAYGLYGAPRPYDGSTLDLAHARPDATWELLGRLDRSLTTDGGVTLHPQPIESALLNSRLCLQARVSLDANLRLQAHYVPAHPRVTPEELQNFLKQHLGPSQCPKLWWPVEKFFGNALGK